MGVTPGVMSILMVLIMLIITSFGTLYYLEARRAYDNVSKSYEMINEYYDADIRAQDYIRNIEENVKNYTNGDIIKESFKINDKQALEISLEIVDNNVKIISYKRTVNSEMEY